MYQGGSTRNHCTRYGGSKYSRVHYTSEMYPKYFSTRFICNDL